MFQLRISGHPPPSPSIHPVENRFTNEFQDDDDNNDDDDIGRMRASIGDRRASASSTCRRCSNGLEEEKSVVAVTTRLIMSSSPSSSSSSSSSSFTMTPPSREEGCGGRNRRRRRRRRRLAYDVVAALMLCGVHHFSMASLLLFEVPAIRSTYALVSTPRHRYASRDRADGVGRVRHDRTTFLDATAIRASSARSLTMRRSEDRTSPRRDGRISCDGTSRGGTALHSSSFAATNGDASDGDGGGGGGGNDDVASEFRPRTMTVSESAAFYVRFVLTTILDNRARRGRDRDYRRRLRDRMRRVTFARGGGRGALGELHDGKMRGGGGGGGGRRRRGIVGSIRKLDESRKGLIRLVGYDSSMMVPGEKVHIAMPAIAHSIPVFALFPSAHICFAFKTNNAFLFSLIGQ